ncbi:hypothetical protein AWZ03_010955 [Drosophila navojoa]|uniref:Cadherin domain-containing protein n=1 Tax=Drosophila navojoa TaxID=7232 RepID=A0A484B197_DRONA|nr:hypothetical protein AWZ03_010955 [Drosophila navojoa]
MTAYRLLTISILIGILCLHHVHGVDPKFDPSTRMRLVLVPADAQVGSVIYRLRATDEEFDYPLTFEFMGDVSSSTFKVESLPCTKYNSVCQANVVLQRRLESGRFYDFQVSVRDTNGGMATQLCSITATNFSTPHDLIFPHKPGIIMIPEDAKRGTELDYVISRKNPLFPKPVYLELWGSPLFAIRQKIISAETTEGTVFLLGPLDFEKQAMYHLTILANDAYAEPGQDGRNIAGIEIVIIVQDVQDQPPVFTIAPPVTKLQSGILPGDKTLTPLQTQYKAENKVLFWLLILLATLVALTILILLLCCICSWCPLYGAATKRIVNISRTEDDVHLVHREMANGNHTKSVQVAEWMGRREAWSADKPSDTRTKPTRWEFRDGREQTENVEMHHAGVNTDADAVRHAASEEYQQRRVRIKNSNTAKEDTHSFHNSRTNLINHRDVYIEDVMDDQNLVQIKEELSRNKQNRPLEHSRLKNYDSDARQIDDDSMRRHEIDRGSDIDFNTAQNSLKNKRELFIKDGNVEILQLMTRDKTRDGAALEDDNIYVNVPVKSSANLSHPQLLMVDNTGKEILMRRFIEEQPDGKQIIREHYHIVPGTTYIQSMPNEIQGSTLKGDTFPLGKSGPNSIVYSQTEPEVKVIHTQSVQGAEDIAQLQPVAASQSLTQELEHSLKQQNALLRQILLEKEKLETRYTQHEIILETQSLPGQSMAIGTQTDCDAGTQTEQTENFSAKQMVHSQAQVGSTRRRARSENDDSLSEDEYKYVRFSPPNSPEGVYWIKRHQPKRRLRLRGSLQPQKRIVMVEEVKRKIRTPIKEEDEMHEKKRRMPPKKPLRETKTSILRKQLSDESRRSDVAKESNGKHKSEALSREVLMEISDSLDENRGPRSRRSEHYYDNFEGEVDENDTEYSIDSDDNEIRLETLGAMTHKLNIHPTKVDP